MHLHITLASFRWLPVLNSSSTWADDRATVGTDPSANPRAVYRSRRVVLHHQSASEQLRVQHQCDKSPDALSPTSETPSGNRNDSNQNQPQILVRTRKPIGWNAFPTQIPEEPNDAGPSHLHLRFVRRGDRGPARPIGWSEPGV